MLFIQCHMQLCTLWMPIPEIILLNISKQICMGRNSVSNFSSDLQWEKTYRLKFWKQEAGEICLLSFLCLGWHSDRYSQYKYSRHLHRPTNSEISLLYWRSLDYVIKGLALLMNCHRQRNQNKLITEVSSHAPCYCRGCHRKAITLMVWVWNRVSHEAFLSIIFQTKEGYCLACGIHGTRGISFLDCTAFFIVSLG